MSIDIGDWHSYFVIWTSSIAAFAVDGPVYRTVPDPPQYPMQLEVAVFDFPEWSTEENETVIPSLSVDWIRHTPGGDTRPDRRATR